jgi:hypothetical protein
MKSQIPIHKSQTIYNSKITIPKPTYWFGILVIGYWDLFVIWNLYIGI